MKVNCATCFFVLVLVGIVYAQYNPPRLNVPGAVLVNQGRPIPYRQQQKILLQEPQPLNLRIRKPIPIRPVIEENDDGPSGSATFEDEVSRLGLSALQSAVKQAEEEPPTRPAQIQFRPERPVPVLREDVRENYPAVRPIQTARPVIRQQLDDNVRQSVRAQRPQQPQRTAAPARIPARPANDEEEDYAGRKRKPVVQILRKYRTDNPDGSITWGFENEDGTFKEETIGVDCIIRGKYGYVDPDGVKREYSYESGNPCDPVEEEEDDLPPLQGAGKSQIASRNQPRPQQQLRPLHLSQQLQ